MLRTKVADKTKTHFINKVEDQQDATTKIIDLQFSSTCFGQFFADLQECKTELQHVV